MMKDPGTARGRALSLVAMVAVIAGVLLMAPGPSASAQGTVSASFECSGDVPNLFGYTVTASGTAYWSHAPNGYAVDRIDYRIQAFKDGAPVKMGNKSNIDITYFDESGQTRIYRSPDKLRPTGTLQNRNGSPLFVTKETFVQVVTVTADVKYFDPRCQSLGVVSG